MPVRFFFRYMGERAKCLLCVCMTRHEYGADTSLHASANEGIKHGGVIVYVAVTVDSPYGFGRLKAETSVGVFTVLGSSSTCSKLAMLLRDGRKDNER